MSLPKRATYNHLHKLNIMGCIPRQIKKEPLKCYCSRGQVVLHTSLCLLYFSRPPLFNTCSALDDDFFLSGPTTILSIPSMPKVQATFLSLSNSLPTILSSFSHSLISSFPFGTLLQDPEFSHANIWFSILWNFINHLRSLRCLPPPESASTRLKTNSLIHTQTHSPMWIWWWSETN